MAESEIIIGPEPKDNSNKEPFSFKLDNKMEDGRVIHKSEEIKNGEELFKSSFLSLKKNVDFIYAERSNVDSIAFILFATNTDDIYRIGMTYELQPSIGKSIIKAFTSSIPFDQYDNDLNELVKEQVFIQSGFKVTNDEIEYLGKSFVSSKMSEYCHLFGITVNKLNQQIKTTTDIRKSNSAIHWSNIDDLKDLEDWKAQIIVFKRFLSKKNQVIVNSK